MTPKDFEISTVGRPNFAALVQFGHTHNACVRQIHWTISVLFKQCENFRDVVREFEVQNEVTARQELQPGTRIGDEKCQLVQDRFAGMKRTVQTKLFGSPIMVRVRTVQQGFKQTGVGDSYHGGRLCGRQ